MTRPTVSELLREPDALLSRTHLRELRLERRAVDAFRGCPAYCLRGYARPLIKVAGYRAFLEQHCHDGKTSVRYPNSSLPALRAPEHESRSGPAVDEFCPPPRR